MQLKINSPAIWIFTKPIDFRKSIDGLCNLITTQFNKTPSDGVFIFFSSDYKKSKLLAWHNNGFVLVYKRLEQGRFYICNAEEQLVTLDPRQLGWLLAGLDWISMSSWGELDFEDYN